MNKYINLNIKPIDRYYCIFDSVISGLFLSTFLYIFGFLYGQEAVNYYGEVHLSSWNSNVHTIFMPFTIFGVLISIPALLRMPKQSANLLQECVYYFYLSHYLTISFKVALAFALIYYFVQERAQYYYKNNIKTAIGGLAISITSLVIQEVVGHQYGGDDPSRLDAVFNAILYANYYAVANLIGV